MFYISADWFTFYLHFYIFSYFSYFLKLFHICDWKSKGQTEVSGLILFLFYFIQKGTTQCYETCCYFDFLEGYSCFCKSLKTLGGALGWDRRGSQAYCYFYFCCVSQQGEKYPMLFFWQPENQNAVFFLLAMKRRRYEQRRPAGPMISLPDFSDGESRPGLDPSVSSVCWQADANLKVFSHSYYLLLYVSISFVSDCTKCPCWLFCCCCWCCSCRRK